MDEELLELPDEQELLGTLSLDQPLLRDFSNIDGDGRLHLLQLDDVFRISISTIKSEMEAAMHEYDRIIEMGSSSSLQLQSILQKMRDTKNKFVSVCNSEENMMIQRFNMVYSSKLHLHELPLLVEALPLPREPGTPDSTDVLREESIESPEAPVIENDEDLNQEQDSEVFTSNIENQAEDMESTSSSASTSSPEQIVDCVVSLPQMSPELVHILKTEGKCIVPTESEQNETQQIQLNREEVESIFAAVCRIERDLKCKKFTDPVHRPLVESNHEDEDQDIDQEGINDEESNKDVERPPRIRALRDRVLEWINSNANQETDSDSDWSYEEDSLGSDHLSSDDVLDGIGNENHDAMSKSSSSLENVSDIDLEEDEDEEVIRRRILGLDTIRAPGPSRLVESMKEKRRDIKLQIKIPLGSNYGSESDIDNSSETSSEVEPDRDLIDILSTDEFTGSDNEVEFLEQTQGIPKNNTSGEEVEILGGRKRTVPLQSSSSDDEDFQILDDISPSPKKPRLSGTENEDMTPSLDSTLSILSPKPRKPREIMRPSEMSQSSKLAMKAEKQRKENLKEKEKLEKELGPILSGDGLVLDYDLTSKEPVVIVDHHISMTLKDYQKEGVKFMYNCCFESITKAAEPESGSGCILAHCMGLGKTIQALALCNTVLSTDCLNVKRVLILAPLSTVNNWTTEYKRWIQPYSNIVWYNLTLKQKLKQLARIKRWNRNGGVAIFNYEAYTALVRKLDREDSNTTEQDKSNNILFRELFVDPGPDILICDEGHRLKSAKTQKYKEISKMKTKRKIMLTGTPIQNDLNEYYFMINLCKPNVLGNLEEFRNRFVNPIAYGQHSDSSEEFKWKMKRRIYLLSKQVKGFIQRNDLNVLKGSLPTKYEYVIPVRLSPLQEELYKNCVDSIANGNAKILREKTLTSYHLLQKICTHPKMLIGKPKSTRVPRNIVLNEIEMEANQIEDLKAEKALEKFMSSEKCIDTLFSGKNKNQICNDWTVAGKLIVLQDIINQCKALGEKLLVFSRYTTAFDLIEQYLAHLGGWEKGKNYLRFDGNTSGHDRTLYCNQFNNDPNFNFFLISKLTGGLGINLHGANRVVLFDVSFNPSEDSQSIFRVYRIGQVQPCYVYRLVSEGTMEERIYCKDVLKLALSSRVVDSLQPGNSFQAKHANLLSEYTGISELPKATDTPKDPLLQNTLENLSQWVSFYSEHDSLLAHRDEERLDDDQMEFAAKEIDKEIVEEKDRAQPKNQVRDGAQPKKRERKKNRNPSTELDSSRSVAGTQMQAEGLQQVSQVIHEAGTPPHHSDAIPQAGTPPHHDSVASHLAGTPPHARLGIQQAGTPPPESVEINQAGTPPPHDTLGIQQAGTPSPESVEINQAGTPTPHESVEINQAGTPTPHDSVGIHRAVEPHSDAVETLEVQEPENPCMTHEQEEEQMETQPLTTQPLQDAAQRSEFAQGSNNDQMDIPFIFDSPVLCELLNDSKCPNQPDVSLMDLLQRVKAWAIIKRDNPENEDDNVEFESHKSFAIYHLKNLFGPEQADDIIEQVLQST